MSLKYMITFAKDISENLESLICAEETTSYNGKEKVVPFFYNSHKKVKLYNGDALELLKRIPDKWSLSSF
ncbi:MAG: hypothetical protein OHK0032_04350 [Thermodesulfovibrionales bacterium]